MPESTINQRLKILIDALGLKVRTFSTTLEVSEATTRNYLDRGSKPGADYLQKIVERFERANIMWLLTGLGEPLLPNSGETSEPSVPYQKNISGNVVGSNRGTMSQSIIHGSHGSSVEEWSEQSKEAFAALMRENELLRSQLADKERIIQLLEKSSK